MSVIAGLALLSASAVYAQDEACTGTFAVSEWREAMDAVDRAVSVGKGGLAQNILDQIFDALRCSGTLADPVDLGRFARQMSVTAFSRQEFDEATRWAQLAREALGDDASWSDTLVRTDAYTRLEEELENPQVSGPDARGLLAPKKGGILIDGRLATRPEASVSVPHLVQVADKSGLPLEGRWMDGAAFPDDLLGEDVVAVRPKWYVDPDIRARVAEPSPVVAIAPTPIADSDNPPECPWRVIKKASVEGSAVSINKTVYDVRSDIAEMGFLDILYSCDEFEAAGRFQKWRTARAVNPFEGSMDRDAMIRALLAD